MKQQKKNRLFTFICSLIPGAAEMYMGFMKMGFSTMAIFCLSFIIPAAIGASDIFIFGAILIWFYSFFHARNLAACEDEIFESMTDVYIWEDFLDGRQFQFHVPSTAVRKWGAVILIVFGAVLLWENLSGMILACIPVALWDTVYPIVDTIVNKVPEVVIAVLIIAAGIRMIRGKKESLDGEGEYIQKDID